VLIQGSFKFCMGDKIREEMAGGKRDEIMQILFLIKKRLFFRAHKWAHTFKIVGSLSFLAQKNKLCNLSGPEMGKNFYRVVNVMYKILTIK
jgi:hypothetical protein